MSRVTRNPLTVPTGVDVNISGQSIKIKGAKGNLDYSFHPAALITKEGNLINFAPKANEINAEAVAGTMRALVKNMLDGVSKGFERKLILIGVGFRAQAQGKVLNLSLGFSHPIKYDVPNGITIDTPTQTEIIIKGADRQVVGQVAADIRAYRPPEPYKGKGVRYEGEVVILKEGKKK